MNAELHIGLACSVDSRRLMARVLYEHMAAGQTFDHPPRQSERVNLSLVVSVTPLIDGQPRLESSFFTITKDISLGGLAFVVNQPLTVEEVLIGIRFPNDAQVTHLRARIRHQDGIGGGFRHVGVELQEVFDVSPYPGLKTP